MEPKEIKKPKLHWHELLMDYAGQLSAGRGGMIVSLLVAILVALLGLLCGINAPVEKMPTIFSYSAQIVVLFLGSAFTFYGSSKATEAFTKKWAPSIAKTVLKNDSLALSLEATAELSTDLNKGVTNDEPSK